jgi:hypothetical protein
LKGLLKQFFFSGKATEDHEVWVEYFDRYARFKDMNYEKAGLFAMFMRDGAAQWLSTLPYIVFKSQ